MTLSWRFSSFQPRDKVDRTRWSRHLRAQQRDILVEKYLRKKNVSCATISSSKYWLLGSSAVIKWSTVWKFSLTSITSSVIPFEATVALNSLLFCCDGLLTLDAVVGHSWINFRQESFRMKMKRWFSYGDQWSNDSIELVFHLLIHTSSCLINSLGSH